MIYFFEKGKVRLGFFFILCYNGGGATVLREVGQGRNPAALSECGLCALFAYRK